jgi:formylglycine-generating enzyme required for sulfatase activity
MVVPPNCQPGPDAVRVRVEAEQRNYFSHLLRQLPPGTKLESSKPCELVLIPYNPELKLPSFYMLQDKVWNELFAAFDKQYLLEHPGAAGSAEWPDDWKTRGAARGEGNMPAAGFPMHPVMNVSFEQAKAFAHWLGGSLPTCDQWDTAAGLYASSGEREGPFLGNWEASEKRPFVAVDRAIEGTMPVGELRDDVSPLGCRDMAGNGAEWTRDASSGGFSTVPLRGRRYDKARPLLFDDLRDPKHLELESEAPDVTSPYIGFRVVLEMPSLSQ